MAQSKVDWKRASLENKDCMSFECSKKETCMYYPLSAAFCKLNCNLRKCEICLMNKSCRRVK